MDEDLLTRCVAWYINWMLTMHHFVTRKWQWSAGIILLMYITQGQPRIGNFVTIPNTNIIIQNTFINQQPTGDQRNGVWRLLYWRSHTGTTTLQFNVVMQCTALLLGLLVQYVNTLSSSKQRSTLEADLISLHHNNPILPLIQVALH